MDGNRLFCLQKKRDLLHNRELGCTETRDLKRET